MDQIKERTKFLEVLCILTIIGSLVFSIAIFTMEGSKELSTAFQLSILILNLGTGAAAWMMWNSKKIGLYIYTFCELAAIIIPFVIVYNARPGFQAFIAISMIGILALFSIVMVVLYWVAFRKNWG